MGDDPSAQLVIQQQTFGLATFMIGFLDDPADGILGLGFTSLAVDYVPPPLVTAIQENLLPEPIFTVWMEHRVRQIYMHFDQYLFWAKFELF